ncbi:MAG: response regulator transcription factor [Thermoleophilia bacterium]|nr:response regulator transcription factor [Thermoleophilia bacterium]
MSRILVVDDEETIRDAVRYLLQAEGLEVVCRSDGTSALETAAQDEFDLIVLDVMLGDISGIEVARRVRSGNDVPILLLTARDGEADVVLGFEAGADDYVVKPFSKLELVSRARAILRRRELDRAAPERGLRAGDVSIDLLRHEAFVAGRPAQLTPTELRILSTLAEEDRAYTRRELLEAAWDTSFVPDDRSCDGHIANLRRKIEDDPSKPERILTVRGVGYRLRRS